MRWRGTLLAKANLALHPPAPSAALSPLAGAMVSHAQTRESARLQGLHRAVSAEIAAAKGRPGFDADRLQSAVDATLTLDRAPYRGAAIERLNKLRLAIPLPRETFRPAGQGETGRRDLSLAPKTPEPKAVSGHKPERIPRNKQRTRGR